MLGAAGVVIAIAVQARVVDEQVRACATGQGVGIGSASDRVGARAAVDAVRTGVAVEHVIAVGAGEGIAARRAFHDMLEDEMAGIERVFQVAAQAQLEAVAAGIGVE